MISQSAVALPRSARIDPSSHHLLPGTGRSLSVSLFFDLHAARQRNVSPNGGFTCLILNYFAYTALRRWLA
jgi:hypothetical protein